MNSPQKIWNSPKANAYKNWGIAILALIVIYFAFFNKPTPPSLPIVDNSPLLEEVRRLKGENDQKTALVTQHSIEKAIARRLADSLAKALKTKPKYIMGVDKVIYQKDTVINVDTVFISKGDTAFYMKHTDPWISLVASSIRGRAQFSLSTYDTLNRTEIVKTPLFRRTTREIAVRNSSPYNKAQKAYSWVTKDPKTWLSIGPYVGYDILTQKPSAGISVQYPLMQIRK